MKLNEFKSEISNALYIQNQDISGQPTKTWGIL